MENPEIESLFCDLLASNHGPGYFISILSASRDRSVIDVELRFVAGRTYCCAEPGCHLPSDTGQQRLHLLAAERGIKMPEAVTVRWHCHVEEGAKLEHLAKLGLPVESKAYDFEVIYGAGVV